MSQHNYKSLSVFKLKEYLELTKEDYSIGEAINSVLRHLNKPENTCNTWIRETTDEQFYKAVETAVKEEQYEKSEDNIIKEQQDIKWI